MKRHWLLSTVLGVALLASVALNGWMYGTLRLYRYNFNQGWFSYSDEGVPAFPVVGVDLEDLKAMAETISNETKETDDHRILGIEVIDRDLVVVITGRLEGPLSGGGRVFRFKRTDHGWELENEGYLSWVS